MLSPSGWPQWLLSKELIHAWVHGGVQASTCVDLHAPGIQAALGLSSASSVSLARANSTDDLFSSPTSSKSPSCGASRCLKPALHSCLSLHPKSFASVVVSPLHSETQPCCPPLPHSLRIGGLWVWIYCPALVNKGRLWWGSAHACRLKVRTMKYKFPFDFPDGKLTASPNIPQSRPHPARWEASPEHPILVALLMAVILGAGCMFSPLPGALAASPGPQGLPWTADGNSPPNKGGGLCCKSYT